MKHWSKLLLMGWLFWGCASVSESPVPVMGVGSKQKSAEVGATAADVIAPVSAEGDSASALAQALLFLPFKDESKYKEIGRAHV